MCDAHSRVLHVCQSRVMDEYCFPTSTRISFHNLAQGYDDGGGVAFLLSSTIYNMCVACCIYLGSMLASVLLFMLNHSLYLQPTI